MSIKKYRDRREREYRNYEFDLFWIGGPVELKKALWVLFESIQRATERIPPDLDESVLRRDGGADGIEKGFLRVLKTKLFGLLFL